MTVAEFLAFEEVSQVRHEYVRGEAFAMSGSTYRHGQIAGNIFSHLKSVARGGLCHVTIETMLVQVDQDHIYYPDVAVECVPRGGDDRVLDSPCILVEVTSKSTRRIDRTEKLENYRKIPSLQLYLIVDQMRRRVTRHWRNDHEWLIEEFDGSAAVPIPVLDISLSLDMIYEGVEMPPLSVAEAEAYEWGEDD